VKKMLLETGYSIVPFDIHTVAGAEHGLAGAALKDVEDAYQSALRFLNKHMGMSPQSVRRWSLK
jgi:hypothetical protein